MSNNLFVKAPIVIYRLMNITKNIDLDKNNTFQFDIFGCILIVILIRNISIQIKILFLFRIYSNQMFQISHSTYKNRRKIPSMYYTSLMMHFRPQ